MRSNWIRRYNKPKRKHARQIEKMKHSSTDIKWLQRTCVATCIFRIRFIDSERFRPLILYLLQWATMVLWKHRNRFALIGARGYHPVCSHPVGRESYCGPSANKPGWVFQARSLLLIRFIQSGVQRSVHNAQQLCTDAYQNTVKLCLSAEK